MRFDSIRARGIGPFRDEVFIDFAAIDGPLIAITGDNGAGKSTLLEMLAGSLHRECPTRGSLASLATSRDAFVETRVVNGATHTIRHTVDGQTGKGEALVLDHAGAPELPSTSVRAFDAWAASHLPSPEVLLASTFSAQGSGGFVELKAGDRKAVLLRVLGIERLEALAKQARDRAAEAKADATTARVRLEDETRRGGDLEIARAAVADLTAKRAASSEAAKVARAELDAARAVADELRKAEDARREVIARRSAAIARGAALAQAVADLEKKIANNRGVLEQAEEIRAAVARGAELEALLAQHRVDLASLQAEQRAQESALQRIKQRIASANAALVAAQTRASRAEGRLADRDRIAVAARSVQSFRDALATADRAIEICEREIEARRASLDSASERRIAGLRGGFLGMGGLPAGECWRIADATIAADNTEDDLCARHPSAIAASAARLSEHRERQKRAARELAEVERLAARTSDIATAERDLAEARKEAEAANAELAEAQRAEAAWARSGVSTREATNVVAAYESDLALLRPIAAKADPLARAEARLAELQPQFEAARAENHALLADLATMTEPPSREQEFVAAASRAFALETDAAAKDRLVESYGRSLAVAEADLARATESAARIEQLRADFARLDEALADWTRLGDDLGRDGLQSLEIDAAGPELTEMVNDLLRTCVGSRWTVSIEASRASSDGKKTLEGCEVRVIDGESGREGTAESLSGGERVIVGEAVSLALSMLACRRSGSQGASLIRDESGAALDPSNARAYVAMLRRAAEIVGASKVIFVSHSPEVQDLADARIEIRNGRVVMGAAS